MKPSEDLSIRSIVVEHELALDLREPTNGRTTRNWMVNPGWAGTEAWLLGCHKLTFSDKLSHLGPVHDTFLTPIVQRSTFNVQLFEKS
jgi:hypothetical protein